MDGKAKLKRNIHGLMFILKAVSMKKYHVLKPGQYKIWWSEKNIVYHTACGGFCAYFPRQEINRFLDGFSFRIRQSQGGYCFSGQAILFTLNGEYKVFDLEKSRILTCLPEEKKRLVWDNIRHFRGCLNVTVLEVNEKGIIEKYIPYRNRDLWTEDEVRAGYLEILDDQMRLTLRAKREYVKNGREILKEIMDYGISEISGLCRRIEKNTGFDVDIPFIRQHGDVHFGNVLFCGKEHFYIDFEYARTESFLFDLFNCIYVEMTDRHSLILAEDFFSRQQEFADRYKVIFENVGMRYQKQRNKDYFLLFLLSRIRFDIDSAFRRFPKCRRKKYFDLLLRKYNGVLGYLEGI